VPLNVRIVSATHKDLADEVAAGRFRQDLFYRLNVIRVAVPPLRERRGDLEPISVALLERIARDAGVSPAPRLTPAARERLHRYPFPGNVRELENLLHRAVALSGGDLIDAHDLGLPDEVLQDVGGDTEPGALGSSEAEAAAQPVSGVVASLPDDLAAYLDEIERAMLVRALEQHGFNRTAAGARLGLSLRQMRYRMARLGITEHGSPAADDA
jgi:two-component system response regulator PilR (NtrC family)